MDTGKKSLFISIFALLASSGTLICCALPIIIVSIGFGSVMVALNTQWPIFGALTQYKIWIFVASGGLLLLSAWQLYATRNICPADPKLADTCKRIKSLTAKLFVVAGIIWVIGFIAAYVALPIRIWLNI